MEKAIYNTLLIDDNKTTNLLNQLLLLKHGSFGKIHTALNGNIALKYLAKSDQSIICPDIIFLDLDMPGIDGWTFLEILKKTRKDLIQKIPIIVLTTMVTYEVMDKTKKNQCIYELINKPLMPETVANIYQKYFNKNTIELI